MNLTEALRSLWLRYKKSRFDFTQNGIAILTLDYELKTIKVQPLQQPRL
jgi:hypothetical protein